MVTADAVCWSRVSSAAARTSRRISGSEALSRMRARKKPQGPVPSWTRSAGRAGEGDSRFSAAATRVATGALGQRLALQSAATSAKIPRPRTDEASLRDPRFALADGPNPAVQTPWPVRDPASQPTRLDALGSASLRPSSTSRSQTRESSPQDAAWLQDCVRGQSDRS